MIMVDAGLEGPRPSRKVSATASASRQSPPAGVPLPTITAVLGHANLQTTAVYTIAASLEAQDVLARMWD